MDEPIRVETAINYGDFKRFSWFNVLRRGRGLRPAFIVLLASFALCALTSAMIAANEGTQVFMQRSGSTLLVVLLFFPFYFLMLSLMFRFTFKRSANVITATQRFEFTGDSLRVECAGQVMTGSTETGYENFYRAYETKSDLYLYINKIQAFMLPKRDLAGNEEKLIALLKGKMGKNYIKCF